MHYVAADISPVMLRRAQALVKRRDLDLNLIRLNVEAMPFADATFDVCVCHGSLHGFPDPAAAVAEIARVLRPGAIIRGTTFVLGTGARRDKIIRRIQRRGVFGPAGSVPDLEGWLRDAGFVNIAVLTNGVVADFHAHRPGGGDGHPLVVTDGVPRAVPTSPGPSLMGSSTAASSNRAGSS